MTPWPDFFPCFAFSVGHFPAAAPLSYSEDRKASKVPLWRELNRRSMAQRAVRPVEVILPLPG
jgi:hypothetical protein